MRGEDREGMRAGEVLDGRYQLVELIGNGGMGAVWRARDRTAGREVALKVLHAHLTEEKELITRFLREAAAALEARYSAHVIEVLDAVHPPGRPPYLVMEFLEGEDLRRIIEREGALDEQRAVDLIIQTCEALDEVHRAGLIHRDIKPDNLLVTRLPSGAEWIKLLDFGVVKFSAIGTGMPSLTATGVAVGTPHYMAPEQALSPGRIDHRVDVYSAGVVLYQALTGQLPHDTDDFRQILVMIARTKAPPLRSVRPDVSEGLEAVVRKTMALEPDARYQTMFELAEALHPFSSARGRGVIADLGTVKDELPMNLMAELLAHGEAESDGALELAPAQPAPAQPAPVQPAPVQPAAAPARPAGPGHLLVAGVLLGVVAVAGALGIGSILLLARSGCGAAEDGRSDTGGTARLISGAADAGPAKLPPPPPPVPPPLPPPEAVDAAPAADAAPAMVQPPADAGRDAAPPPDAAEKVAPRPPRDDFGGLSRRVVVDAMKSISPGVQRCLVAARRRPGAKVVVQFKVATNGTFSFRSSQPSLPPAVAKCVAYAAKSARVRGRPNAPFSARYAYRVPR
jgi:eukaryotic-like serine/threonine-protein kinase